MFFSQKKKTSVLEQGCLVFFKKINLIKLIEHDVFFPTQTILDIGDMVVIDKKPMIVKNILPIIQLQLIDKKNNNKKFLEIYFTNKTTFIARQGILNKRDFLEKERKFNSISDAKIAYHKMIKEKINKGYNEMSTGRQLYVFICPTAGINGEFRIVFKNIEELKYYSKLYSNNINIIKKK